MGNQCSNERKTTNRTTSYQGNKINFLALKARIKIDYTMVKSQNIRKKILQNSTGWKWVVHGTRSSPTFS